MDSMFLPVSEMFCDLKAVSPMYTLLFPFRTLPYTDGRSWARKPGLERHHGIYVGEELTDEEDN